MLDKKVKKREIFGWAMFDFANSSYTTVVITAIYAPFFVDYIVPAQSAVRDTYWSLAIIISTLLVILISPLLGILCEYTGYKKRYLLASTLICAVSTSALFFVDRGNIFSGIALLVISNASFMLSENFCASFLPDLANKDNMGLISGIGWGIGYVGGLTSLILIMGIITAKAGTDLFIQQNQWGMGAIGLFFLIAALPTFILVKERSFPKPGFEKVNLKALFKASFEEISSSFKLAKEYSVLFQFLFAFMIYMAGVEVVIKFVGIYATAELKFATAELTIMFLIIQCSAMVGAIGFGYFETRYGAKATVLSTLALWILGVMAIFFLEFLSNLFGVGQQHLFFAISLIAGMGIGATQSSSRAVVGLLTPAQYSAKMFGFWGMFGRLAVILGMTFGFVSDALSSRRLALLLVVAFFILGGLILKRIPLRQGIETARKESI